MINWLLSNPVLFALLAFILGSMVGSLLNVCIARMPLQKSILWPGSHCGNCHKPIRWFDNIPLISYVLLRGKCRQCGAKFSSRYFWVELLTGLSFAGLFWVETQWNILGLGGQPFTPLSRSMQSNVLFIWAYHCFLFMMLIVAFFTDVEHQEIPLRITIPGAIVGVIGGTLFPWPWPLASSQVMPAEFIEVVHYGGMWTRPGDLFHLQGGLQRWPVWMPAPEWLGAGTWQMGLVTSLAGMLVGWLSFWLIRVVFTWALDKEAMGLGDADLMLMIGAFLGWQLLVFVFILAMPFALLYAVLQLLRNKSHELPFGPFLALGAVLTTVFSWWWAASSQWAFFDGLLIVRVLMLIAGLGLFVLMTLRMFRLVGRAA